VCRLLKKNDLPAGQRRPLSLPGYSWLPWPSGRHHSYREDTNYHTTHISAPDTFSSVSERTVHWIMHHSNKNADEWPLCGVALPHRHTVGQNHTKAGQNSISASSSNKLVNSAFIFFKPRRIKKGGEDCLSVCLCLHSGPWKSSWRLVICWLCVECI